MIQAQQNDLKRLVATERAFARAAENQGVREAFIQFFAEDGVVFQPAAVNAREHWMARPESGALLVWSPAWADIASTGDMGYTTGPWEFKPAGPAGPPIAFGQYITVWKKQSDGNFRAVVDIGVSHPQPGGPPDTECAFPGDIVKQSDVAISGDRPALTFMSETDYRPMLADDVRIFRDQQFPVVGQAAALRQIRLENDKIASGAISDATCDGSGDLHYCYGTLQRTTRDGSVETGNLLRIFKCRDRQWRLVLEVFGGQ